MDAVHSAPGYAPVVDPCGQAGGEWHDQHIGGDSVFTNTSLSKWGDMGSKLPPNKLLPRWKAGSQVSTGGLFTLQIPEHCFVTLTVAPCRLTG